MDGGVWWATVHGVAKSRTQLSDFTFTFLYRDGLYSPHLCFFMVFKIISFLVTAPAAAAESLQSCPTVGPQRRQPVRFLCPWDSPGKNTGVGCHFLLQCVKVKSLSRVRLFATPWTAAYQAPPSMRFSRQEYWSGVPLPSPIYIIHHTTIYIMVQ